jgi:RHS repeat-associated protein
MIVTTSSQTKTENYYYAGHQLVEVRDGSDQVKRQFIYGNGIDEVVRMDVYNGSAITSYYLHTNEIGSTTAVTDANGQVVDRYKYGLYGMPIFMDAAGNVIPKSAIGNNILFQGREYEPETNFYYFRARHFDPIMGRFLQNDPMGYEDSLNLYQGLNMNPVNFKDPWGLSTDFNSFGTNKSFSQALNSLVVTKADKRQMARTAEGGANLIPSLIYWIQDLFEVATGTDIFEEDSRFRFNFSEPGSTIQIYSTEKRTYWEKVRDATVVYPTGKFLADTGSNFILGYNDPYVMNTPVGQEARENFDRQLIPLGATSYGVYKGISLINTKGQAAYNSVEPYASEPIYSAEFQQWLTKGEKNVGNYIGNDPITGEPIYTGITNNFEVRQYQWRGIYDLQKINEGNLFRNQARCIEQVIKVKNPDFKNINNPINQNRAIYNEALNWGINWLKSMGIEL